MKLKTPTRDQLHHIGSIITYDDGGKHERCLGDLMHFDGHGTFDPNFGRVDITKEEAELHNKALDAAMLEGLDKWCQKGQGSYAYYTGNYKVTTFIGTVISEHVRVRGRIITFQRNGKMFRGTLKNSDGSFNYRML